MKKIIKAAIISAVSAFMLLSARAYAKEIPVKIAPYYTEIAYMSVYNHAVEYPLITYKDVTYLPMTYGLCARLGLAVGFDTDTGLYITRHDSLYPGDETEFFGSAYQNSTDAVYTAVIPEYPIYLNGRLVNNGNMEYPILNFRNITYFPMTYELSLSELGAVTEWSAEEGFKMYRSGTWTNYIGFGKSDTDGVNIILCIALPLDSTLDDGTVVTTTDFRYCRYKLMYDGCVKFISVGDAPCDDDYPEPYLPTPLCDNVSLQNGCLEYDGTKILDLTGKDAQSQYSREYDFGNVSFICTNVTYGNAPAPYNSHEEYIFVKREGKITLLQGWDTNNNFSDIYPDGTGGYYLCSDSYSPTGASRWSNGFSCIYRYSPKGDFYEITIPDTNSLEAIGTHGTKLYVKAMCFYASKELMLNHTPLIDPAKCGYYEIDTQSGECKKLYPYINGETHLTENGDLYCLSVPGTSVRVTDLKTGKQLPIK